MNNQLAESSSRVLLNFIVLFLYICLAPVTHGEQVDRYFNGTAIEFLVGYLACTNQEISITQLHWLLSRSELDQNKLSKQYETVRVDKSNGNVASSSIFFRSGLLCMELRNKLANAKKIHQDNYNSVLIDLLLEPNETGRIPEQNTDLASCLESEFCIFDDLDTSELLESILLLNNAAIATIRNRLIFGSNQDFVLRSINNALAVIALETLCRSVGLTILDADFKNTFKLIYIDHFDRAIRQSNLDAIMTQSMRNKSIKHFDHPSHIYQLYASALYDIVAEVKHPDQQQDTLMNPKNILKEALGDAKYIEIKQGINNIVR